MLTVISPAKSLDFETPVRTSVFSQPLFLNESEKLIKKFRKLKAAEIERLMGVSSKLADLNHGRFQEWSLPFTPENSKPAVFCFTGEVYRGLEVSTMTNSDLQFSQNHLRILSGLYGLLRPLDLMQAYRLEMGTKHAISSKEKNLYEFWGNKITDQVNNDIEASGGGVLLNLASNEYFKAVKPKVLKYPVITPHFKDLKNGEYKALMTFAKNARGLMSRFVLQNEINDVEAIKAFDLGGYNYNERLSSEKDWVFTRDKKPA